MDDVVAETGRSEPAQSSRKGKEEDQETCNGEKQALHVLKTWKKE